MLQQIFIFVHSLKNIIYIVITIAGMVCYVVSGYLKRKEQREPGSVKKCRETTITLSIVGIILLVSVMLALFFDGYYTAPLSMLFPRAF